MPQRGSILGVEHRADKGTVALDTRLVDEHVGVQQRHELDGVALGQGFETVLELGLGVLLRHAHLLVGEDLGVEEAGLRDAVHGIRQLGELDKVAEVDDEPQVVFIAQTRDVGVGAKAQGAGAQQVPVLDVPTVRTDHAAQIARVGQLFKVDTAVSGALSGRLRRQVDARGELVAPKVMSHMNLRVSNRAKM